VPEVLTPLRAFNFEVEIRVPGVDHLLCHGAFAECDGMEITQDVKTIRQGGDNGRQIRLTGPMGFGTLILKRGMTKNFDLWRWVSGYSRTADQRKRAEVKVVIKAADGNEVHATFALARCVPVKLKFPVLNAKDGIVAIEELQLAYESIELEDGGA
jgi:phage tail-like protein